MSSTFVVIRGNMTSCKTAVEYIKHIVYGNPRIEAVQIGGKFVAICEFDAGQETAAKYTFERMGSFPHGAQLMLDKRVALQEFGTWVYSYAPGAPSDI